MFRKIGLTLLICIFALTAFGSAWASDDRKAESNVIVDKARLVIEDMMLSIDNQVPSELINKCTGIVIIPGLMKGGFFVGGSYGQGVVLVRNGNTFSGPAFLSMGAGSLGLQFGVQSADVILVIYGKATMDSFLMNNKVKLGGDIAMVAGPVGAQASAATDLMLKGGIYSYSRSQGLFLGVSLEGAAISMNHALNQAYYGSVYDPKVILTDANLMIPASGERLIKALETAASRGQNYEDVREANKAKNADIDRQLQDLERQQQELNKQKEALENQRPK